MGIIKSVSLPVAEAEAFILPIKTRLLTQRATSWINLHTNPQQHPSCRLQKRLNAHCKRHKSPLEITAADFQSLSLENLELIFPFGISPWQTGLNVRITDDREKAIQEANIPLAHNCGAIFVDGSARKGNTGIGVFSKWRTTHNNKQVTTIEYAKSTGS